MTPSRAVAGISYRPSIDGLRAVAVLLVVVYHAFPGALPGGFVGVDMFFVISGFLISGILYREFAVPGSLGLQVIGRFYNRRIRRIFPALAIVLAACYALGFDVLLPQDFNILCRDIAAAAGFCLNLVLSLQTGYFAPDASTLPLLHLWSLGVEEQFYLFWPLAIWVLYRARLRILPISVFLGGCSFFAAAHLLGAKEESVFFLPQMRLWELMIGAAAATAAEAPPGKLWRVGRNIASLAGVAMVVVGVCRIDQDVGVGNPLMLLPTMGTVILISAGEETFVSRYILSMKPAVWIGLISYPFYLWHWPLLTFTRLTYEDGDSPLYLCVAVAIAGLLAWITYRFVEYPIRHGAKNSLKVALPFAAVFSLGILGYVSHRFQGFPERFPPILRDAYAAAKDHEVPWRAGEYFLSADKGPDSFKVDKNEILLGKPTLFLWGDSHAASLYPGFAKYFSGHYNIVQRTVAGTAPILGLKFPTHPNSEEINDFVFATIKRDSPDTVVLSANWLTYDWSRVEATISALKGVGVGHIIVVGPLPQWKGLGLPQQLYNYYRTHLHDRLPTRMYFGAKDEPAEVDLQMEAFCAREGAEYISPCRLLSNKDGFITRLGDTPESIMTFDYGHLTKEGAEYLVSKFPGH